MGRRQNGALSKSSNDRTKKVLEGGRSLGRPYLEMTLNFLGLNLNAPLQRQNSADS